jgi:hypothetical protein
MKPRGYWGSLLTLAIITFPVSILVWGFFFSLGSSLTLANSLSGEGLWMGLAFAALFSPIMAFFMRKRTIVMPVRDTNAFVLEITERLKALRYHLESRGEGVLTFGPSARAGLLAPKVIVQVGDTSATVVGPRTPIRKLQAGV